MQNSGPNELQIHRNTQNTQKLSKLMECIFLSHILMGKEGSWVIHLLTLTQHILIIGANVVLSVKARET